MTDASGSRLGPVPFWAPPEGDLHVSLAEGDSKPDGFGPELAVGHGDAIPDEGVLVFDQGTIGVFTTDGLAVGHLPREVFERGEGSIVNWLADNDRRVMPMPVVSGTYPCFAIDHAEAGVVEICAREDNLIPSITVDRVALVTEEHWAAFYQESGWDWEQARSTGSGVIGHYRTVDWDPASDTWLFAWSGECESTDALLFRDDRLSHVTGPTWEAAPSSTALGFVDGVAVYVTSPVDPALCGTGADPSAVYAVAPGGEPTMIWSSSEGQVQAVAFGR